MILFYVYILACNKNHFNLKKLEHAHKHRVGLVPGTQTLLTGGMGRTC